MRSVAATCIVLGLIVLVLAPAWAQEDEECMFCHGEPDLTKTLDDGGIISLYVDQEVYDAGVHQPLGCIGCHADIVELPHPETLEKVDCGNCHLELDEYRESVHGRDLANGDLDVTGCGDCHTIHGMRPSDDPLSATHPARLPETCGKCHQDPDLAHRHLMSVVDPTAGYLKGVHARAIREDGNLDAASCNDCHGTHRILPAHNPESPVYHGNIAETCGKCHADVTAEYAASIHGKALTAGVKESPTCTDCHGEHGISPHDVDLSPVSKLQVSQSTCPRCHDDEKVMSKFGIETMRQASYMDSYHGMATAAGSNVEASCTSCHGVHNILPEEDPASTVHPNNLVETCRTCHETANENFAVGKVHLMPTAPDQWVLGLVRVIYIWLIVLTLGGMILHNSLIMVRHAFIKFCEESRGGESTYKRFNIWQTTGHLVLTISFVALVISGFALRFPDAWWTKWMFWGEAGLEMRGLIHRIAGVLLIVVTVINGIYIIGFRSGRKELMSLTMTFKDIRDIFHNLAYVVGLRKDAPRFDRYSYSEKLEYWGLWWGSIVMIVTGLCMWYAEWFMQHFPKLALDVAAHVHYYEAWLATGTIIIWHLYYMIFDPVTYPMNWSWVTGYITEEDFRERHPIQWEREMGTPAEKDDHKE